ncbi:M1 family metallopeptidase [Burkholderia sp. 22PA0099]|uniref:M1 family metallopeptidase n=1 Tax=Burkholderia sp. 22PA0099 TaxID=3237372 RepID=UPI0039C17AC1
MRMPFRKIHYLFAVAALALSACGGGDDDDTPIETPSPPPVTAVDKSVKPVEFPDTVVPINYKLWFRPNADLSQFDGRADVEIDVLKPVTEIVVAARKLVFAKGTVTLQPGNVRLITTPQTGGDFYQLRATNGTIPKGRYTLHMEWQGVINQTTHGDPEKGTKGACDDDPRPNCSAAEGMFRLDLMGTDGSTSGAILTQLESNFARRWFPGWDEPAFRPTYEVSAEVPSDWRVVSNAPEKQATALSGGYQAVSFEKTPPMPSYLLFFGGGRFDVLEDEFTSPLPDDKGLHLRIFTPPGMKEQAKPAMEATKQALDYFYRYTGYPLPLTKLDTVAANDKFIEEKQLWFSGMENWGAILEFADTILPPPGKPFPRGATKVINHEIAHQWFGDLVTLDWWDDVWLNEGVTSYMTTRADIALDPDHFGWEEQVWSKPDIMYYDVSPVPFPMQPNFNDYSATDFGLATKAIYDKAEQVLKMVEGYIGDDAMQRGVQQYVRNYAFGNATPQRLWDALSDASGTDVGQIGNSFARQTGVPVLSIDTRCDLTANQTVVMLSQAPLPNVNFHPGERWSIPVTLAYGNQLALNERLVLSDARAEVRLDGCGAVLANPTGLDYYVTQYSKNARDMLQPALDTVTLAPEVLVNLENDQDMLEGLSQRAIRARQSSRFAMSPPATLADEVATRRLRMPVISMRNGRPISRP